MGIQPQSLRLFVGMLSLGLMLNACSSGTQATLPASSLTEPVAPVEAAALSPDLTEAELEPIPAIPAAAVVAEAIAPTSALSPQQWRSLEALNIPIILPSSIPAGFEPVELETSPGSPNDRMGRASYSVRYQNGGSCFVMETASGGFGGPVPEQSRPISSPRFPAVEGRDYQLYWTEGNGDGPFPESTLFTDWMAGEASHYRLISGDHGGADCDRISPDLAQQLVSSLTEMSSGDSMGQGEAASADFDPYSLVGVEMLEAMGLLQQEGFRPVTLDSRSVRMTKGSMDVVLMLDLKSQQVTEVYAGESAATMCDPAVEQC